MTNVRWQDKGNEMIEWGILNEGEYKVVDTLDAKDSVKLQLLDDIVFVRLGYRTFDDYIETGYREGWF